MAEKTFRYVFKCKLTNLPINAYHERLSLVQVRKINNINNTVIRSIKKYLRLIGLGKADK